MNLSKKKKLAKRTFNVGESRILFLPSRLDEIKDAITKQDMIDLRKSGAIIIKEKKGRKKAKGRRKRSKSTGKTHKNIGKRKKNYVILTRKLRAYLKGIYSARGISQGELNNLRKKIKNKEFKSKAHIKEFLESLKGDVKK